MSSFQKIRNLFVSPLLLIIFFGFIVRLLLFNFGTYTLDFYTFVAWSKDLVHYGISNFYDNIWSDYLPGYLYILYILRKIATTLDLKSLFLLYKLPAIFADLLTGFLIYKIVYPLKGKRWASLSSFFYVFNPAIITNSTLWGQVDSLTALFSLLSLYLLEISPVFSALSLAVGTAIKPQASIVSLVLLFVMLRQKWSFKKIAGYVFTGATATVLIFAPFNSGENIFSFVIKRIGITLNQYNYTSVNAFNFWGLFGFWIKEGQGFINQNLIGLTVFSIIFLFSAYKLINKKVIKYDLTTILFAANFLFFTRMHERHLLPVFAPLAITSALSPTVWFAYLGYSVTYLLNLRYGYDYASGVHILYRSIIPLVIVVNLFIFAFLLFKLLSMKKNKFSFKDIYDWLKKSAPKKSFSLSKKNAKYVLLLIIAFAFFTRTIFLNSPKTEYFDEVYHAFTAKAMLHNDPKAWEWWNKAPEGFAYEWTHPPFAKEVMVVGMKIFGENAFGWRIPAAVLGTLSTLFVFLIAKEIFQDEVIGLLAAGALSLDGLFLVMSRIGMNDMYMLSFALLTFYLYLKNKNFWAALAFGFSIASKWSAVWLVPIIFVTHFVYKKKIKPSYAWFLILPPAVYLASYIPMFLTGHSWGEFIEMQKQMWWYHTRLKATHPYESSWWTWPFMIRPVWLYTSGVVKGMVANIYDIGNPIFFWFGGVSVILSAVYAYFEKNKKLGLVVFSYIMFFAPWALSPRIMFIYHYLPSIPFMAILIGYILRKYEYLILPFFAICFVVFLYFLPHYIGIKVPEGLDLSYYWFTSWR